MCERLLSNNDIVYVAVVGIHKVV